MKKTWFKFCLILRKDGNSFTFLDYCTEDSQAATLLNC